MNIRILTAVLAAGIMIIGCSSSNGNSQNTDNKSATGTTTANTEQGKVIQMNKAMFLDKVFNYEENPDTWVYKGDKPCIIDFYADWCGPCKSIAPVLEELAAEYDGQIYIYKINTETEQELASVFGIRSIPSLLFVPMNEAPQMAQGAMPKSAFKEAIETVLLKKK